MVEIIRLTVHDEFWWSTWHDNARNTHSHMVQVLENSDKKQELQKKLRECGVITVHEYMAPEQCDRIYDEIRDQIQEGQIDQVESGEYSYGELVRWGGPVANRRSGWDEGMLDIFHIDQNVSRAGEFKSDPQVLEMINAATSRPYSPDNVNVYWNRSVTETRPYHADTYAGKFKSFLYLTDVPDTSYGPFCYIKGSHRTSNFKQTISKWINKLRGTKETDAVFFDKSRERCFTAPKGTLIVANQSGYHRGHPQEAGKERMLLTTSYTPD